MKGYRMPGCYRSPIRHCRHFRHGRPIRRRHCSIRRRRYLPHRHRCRRCLIRRCRRYGHLRRGRPIRRRCCSIRRHRRHHYSSRLHLRHGCPIQRPPPLLHPPPPPAAIPPSRAAAPAASHSGREERCAVIGFGRKAAFARVYQGHQNKRCRFFQAETRFLAWHKLLSDTVRLKAINNGHSALRQARLWTAPMIEPAKSFVTGDAYPRRESKDHRAQFNPRWRSCASLASNSGMNRSFSARHCAQSLPLSGARMKKHKN